jgi:hypothetical protein
MSHLTSEYAPSIAAQARIWHETLTAEATAQTEVMEDAPSTPPTAAQPPAVPGAPKKPSELTEALGVLQPTNLCETTFNAIIINSLLDRVQESPSIPSAIKQEFVAAATALLEHLQG